MRAAFAACIVASMMITASAHACRDAGPRTLSCTDGGAAPDTSCSVHADCPSGLVCSAGHLCVCSCEMELCDEAGCRCVEQVPDGCRLEIGNGSALCRGQTIVVCPTDHSLCSDGNCGPDCTCLDEPAPSGGCSVAPIGGTSTIITALVGIALGLGRSRVRRRARQRP